MDCNPPPQPGRAAQPGHCAAGAAAAEAAEGGVLHVLQPLRPVQPWRALPLRPRPREGGRVHQVRPPPPGGRGAAGGHSCPGLPPLRPALCTQVCPGNLQEDGRDLPLLPPRLQGEGELPMRLLAGAAPRLRPSTLLGPPGPLSHPPHAQCPSQVHQWGAGGGRGRHTAGLPPARAAGQLRSGVHAGCRCPAGPKGGSLRA